MVFTFDIHDILYTTLSTDIEMSSETIIQGNIMLSL